MCKTGLLCARIPSKRSPAAARQLAPCYPAAPPSGVTRWLSALHTALQPRRSRLFEPEGLRGLPAGQPAPPATGFSVAQHPQSDGSVLPAPSGASIDKFRRPAHLPARAAARTQCVHAPGPLGVPPFRPRPLWQSALICRGVRQDLPGPHLSPIAAHTLPRFPARHRSSGGTEREIRPKPPRADPARCLSRNSHQWRRACERFKLQKHGRKRSRSGGGAAEFGGLTGDAAGRDATTAGKEREQRKTASALICDFNL